MAIKQNVTGRRRSGRPRASTAYTGLVIPQFPKDLRTRLRAQALLANRPMYEWIVEQLQRSALDYGYWSLRHGSRAVKDGRLTARTDTDYLTFDCPDCGQTHRGGAGIGYEGNLVEDGHTFAVLFRFHCLKCGFRDFFKVPADNEGRYGTKAPDNPLAWARRGRGREKKGRER